MARVDKQALAELLDGLVRQAAIAHWESRPLGMYWITLNTGEVLRPNGVEAAMFAQGTAYGAMVTSARHSAQTSRRLPDPPIDLDKIIERLEEFMPAGVIYDWDLDDDGMFSIVPRLGAPAVRMEPRDAYWFVWLPGFEDDDDA